MSRDASRDTFPLRCVARHVARHVAWHFMQILNESFEEMCRATTITTPWRNFVDFWFVLKFSIFYHVSCTATLLKMFVFYVDDVLIYMIFGHFFMLLHLKRKFLGTRNGVQEYHIRIFHNSFYNTEKNPFKKRLKKTRETDFQSYQFFEKISICKFVRKIGNFEGLFLGFFPIFF